MGKAFSAVTQPMHDYLLSVSLRESPEALALRELTNQSLKCHHMMTSPEQTQFLALLMQLMSVKTAIEIGVFTGYGTLSFARVLPADGKLIACDAHAKWPLLGEPFWVKAGVRDKIDLRIAPALETLQDLLSEGYEGSVDFVYVDAAKKEYQDYYELCLKLLRPGGLIVFDNVLACGENNLVQTRGTAGTQVVDALNHQLHADTRVDISMLSLCEGLFLVRKR
jgi:predicted O-methyltransferase YrrM